MHSEQPPSRCNDQLQSVVPFGREKSTRVDRRRGCELPKMMCQSKLRLPVPSFLCSPDSETRPRAVCSGAECFSLSAGTDIAPLLEGLQNDLCQAPHWGYVARGSFTMTYRDGSIQNVSGGDLFYHRKGSAVRGAANVQPGARAQRSARSHESEDARLSLSSQRTEVSSPRSKRRRVR